MPGAAVRSKSRTARKYAHDGDDGRQRQEHHSPQQHCAALSRPYVASLSQLSLDRDDPGASQLHFKAVAGNPELTELSSAKKSTSPAFDAAATYTMLKYHL